MAEQDTSRIRLSMVGLVCVSLFASLFVRLWYLQLVDQNEFQVRADGVNLRTIHEEGTRGRILDRNGKVLVDNRISIVVGIDRQQIKASTPARRSAEFEHLAATLTSFGLPTKAPVIQKLYDDRRYGPLDLVPVATDAKPELELFIAEHSDEFPGVVVKRKAVRTYPYGTLAAQIVGYVGKISDAELKAKKASGENARSHKAYEGEDEIGKSGIEASAESDLRGTPSNRTIQVDARGNYVTTVKEATPRAGDDVWLTIDLDLQALAEQKLGEQLTALRGQVGKDGKPIRAPQGSVVIVNPSNGELLAMASYPTYDPSQLVNGIDSQLWARLNDKGAGQPLFNWALQGTYAPGSTFKLITATAGLETGFLAPGNDTYNDRGTYTIPNCKGGKCGFSNAGGSRYGTVDLSRAITVSSDVYFYWIGDQLWQRRAQFGDQAIQDVAATYGIGSTTGIALAGEAGGRLPTPAKLKALHEQNPKAFPRGSWYAGDNLNTAIGQGDVLVTPLQLANAYGTFANGGTRYQPQIIFKVTRPADVGRDPADPTNYKLIRQPQPKKLGQVTFTGDHYQRILTGLEGVVQSGDGTAHKPYMDSKPAWPMAGKTGTAQVNGKADTSVFVGFGPTNTPFPPSYAISVIIPESGFGADAAAPVVFRIMQPVSNGQVPPTISAADQKRRDATAASAAASAASTTVPPTTAAAPTTTVAGP